VTIHEHNDHALFTLFYACKFCIHGKRRMQAHVLKVSLLVVLFWFFFFMMFCGIEVPIGGLDYRRMMSYVI
jgi:hypothetical protein